MVKPCEPYIAVPVPVTLFDSLGKPKQTTHSGKLFTPLTTCPHSWPQYRTDVFYLEIKFL